MSRKHFSGLLAAVVVVLIAVVLLLPRPTGKDAQTSEPAWLPDLATRINEVERVSVTIAGGTTVATLQRGEQDWTIAELGGYPADWTRLRGVLAALAQARVLEEKTANPDYHDRLGVEDVADEGAAGVLLTLDLEDAPQAVIIGDAAGQRQGRYLRRADSPQVVLADFDEELPRTAIGWANAEIADLPADNVAEVEIIHPDRDRILVRKLSADDTDFHLDNLPAGRELQSTWSANALGGVLAALSMEAVRPASELAWEQPLLVRVLTFDGMEVRVEAVDEGEQHWLRLSASAPFAALAADPAETPAPPAATPAPPSEPTEAETGSGEEASAVTAESAAEVLSAKVEAFNRQVSGWAYRVPTYKYDAMSKRLDALLKPLDDGADQD